MFFFFFFSFLAQKSLLEVLFGNLISNQLSKKSEYVHGVPGKIPVLKMKDKRVETIATRKGRVTAGWSSQEIQSVIH